MNAHPSAYRPGEPVRVIDGEYAGVEGTLHSSNSDDPEAYVPYVVALSTGRQICFNHRNLEPVDLEWVDVVRAVELANELAAIDRAVSEGQTAFTNAGNERYEFYSTRLFTGLSKRRELLRTALLALGPEQI